MFADLRTRIQQFAREAGFELCGIAPVRDFAELQVFPSWIADERHGEMKYMEARNDAGELKRASLANVAPWARSVIVCAINYNTAAPYSTQTEDRARGWISRYAWSREDYHEAVMRRLRAVESRLRELLDSADSGSADCRKLTTGNSLQTRAYVDTGPLIERVYAKYAGIGWIGKNTCVINQKLGSWLFLGVILTSLDLTSLERGGRLSPRPTVVARAHAVSPLARRRRLSLRANSMRVYASRISRSRNAARFRKTCAPAWDDTYSAATSARTFVRGTAKLRSRLPKNSRRGRVSLIPGSTGSRKCSRRNSARSSVDRPCAVRNSPACAATP